MAKVDLRKTEWRDAITKISKALEETELTNRALALLIADSSPVKFTQVLLVLGAIPKLANKYLKGG